MHTSWNGWKQSSITYACIIICFIMLIYISDRPRSYLCMPLVNYSTPFNKHTNFNTYSLVNPKHSGLKTFEQNSWMYHICGKTRQAKIFFKTAINQCSILFMSVWEQPFSQRLSSNCNRQASSQHKNERTCSSPV